MRNQVQLITYADRLGGTLPGLTALLRGPLEGLFGGVHVLPFFTPIDGADTGFDPIDHTAVDPRLGGWEDVGELGETVEVMADLIVNHVSRDAGSFRDVLERGEESAYAGMFLTLGAVFSDGASEEDLLRIYRPRPGLPFTEARLGERRRIVWTTFTSHQIDLDVDHPETRRYLRGVLERFAAHGVRIVRLDAVGYAIKKPGTSCFMIPETFDFVDELTAWAGELGIEVLVEVHSYYRHQIEIARKVDWVYDFALPPLVLHALIAADARPLRRWLDVRPRNAVTVLDTHDGIGVLDVAPDPSVPDSPGLLDPGQIDDLVEAVHANSRGESRLATGTAASNVDLYQINCTYYDALGQDETAYLIARMIQFFTPGVPQVYYVGLLGGTNDMKLLEQTAVGRDINRHRYLTDELGEALERPLVRRLMALIRLRNTHPAFGGEWSLGHGDAGTLAMEWAQDAHRTALTIGLKDRTFELSVTTEDGTLTVTEPEELEQLAGPV